MSKLNPCPNRGSVSALKVRHLVREIYHTHFLNKTEICRAMDIGVSTLRSWESGRHKPSLADIRFLESILSGGKNDKENKRTKSS